MWPTYATDSYLKWRVPALSFLRVFLVALPFNFSTVVFNAIAPNVDTGGRFAVVGLSFQAFLGKGWRTRKHKKGLACEAEAPPEHEPVEPVEPVSGCSIWAQLHVCRLPGEAVG